MKRAIIKIRDEHIANGEKSTCELTTSGTFTYEKDRTAIAYFETDNELAGCETTLVVENGKRVLMSRTGKYTTALTIEKGCRHSCFYETPFGELMMGIYASYVYSDLHENGGTLKFSYTIDFNNEVASHNVLFIDVIVKEEVEEE